MAQKSQHILVVDDDGDLRELMRLTLELAGHQVTVAEDGKEGLRVFFAEPPDVVLLDVQMPAMDGWTLLERIREVSEVPVIMLTAFGQEWQKVQGLRGGADDYLVKPVGEQELLERIEAVLRRTKSHEEIQDVYQDSVLRIDYRRHEVYVRSQEVQLSPSEFRLLSTLVQNRGMVMSADQLLALCWGDRESGPESVRVYVNYLRKKIEENPAKPHLLENVRGFGYRYRSQGV